MSYARTFSDACHRYYFQRMRRTDELPGAYEMQSFFKRRKVADGYTLRGK